MTWNLLTNKVHQPVAVKAILMLSDNHEKNVQPKAQDAGNAINGITGNKYAVLIKRHRIRKASHDLDHPPEGRKAQDKSNQSRLHVLEESNYCFDELLFDSKIVNFKSRYWAAFEFVSDLFKGWRVLIASR